MPRRSRREDLLETALEHFVQEGYEATSVSELASDLGISKAAVSYHFPAKEDLIVALAEPLVVGLERVVPPDATEWPLWPDGVRDLVAAFLDVLLEYPQVATWLDGDRSVLNGTDVGTRLRRANRGMRRLLAGPEPTERARIAAIVGMGALWRPFRALDPEAVRTHSDLMIESALAPLRLARWHEVDHKP